MSELIGAKVAEIYKLWPIMDDPELLLKKIGLSSNRVYKDLPKSCYICNHDEFSELSLVGIHNEPVFFECSECGALHLKCEKRWLKRQFRDLDDIMADNPDTWMEKPGRKKFN